jgi:hypothetical protein
LLLTHLELHFFLLHLYQSILYVGILVLLFYMEDRWAYMIGMLASVVWLGMAYGVGILGESARRLAQLSSFTWTSGGVGLVAAVTSVIAVLMIVFCARHWMREYAGLGKARSTFLVSLGIVGRFTGYSPPGSGTRRAPPCQWLNYADFSATREGEWREV